ncbi:MAG: HTH-type transcriptional regulator BenM [Verrucomicrobiae bacterium]|nr:HTH-type transcriptional regulator BenM [Verrucomicrobiae bacterium]
MELRHLLYFVTVAEELNFSRAAARLRVAQPAISRQIRDLEESLGLKLFERTARSVRLTEAGRVFVVEAQAVLRRMDDAVATVRATGKQGQFRLGYAPSLTVEILSPALRRFQETNPGMRVALHDLSTQEMLAGLCEERLDLALLARPAKAALAGLRFEELRRYAWCVAVPVTHPLARRREVGLPVLTKERLLAYDREQYPEYHTDLARILAGRPAIAEEHDSATSLIAAVEAGRGVAIVPECLACLAGERLRLRPLVPAPPALIVGAAYRGGRGNVVAEVFLGAIR